MYVDGYVLAVPKANLAAYKKMAKKCAVIWKEYGAIECVECVEEDVASGKLTSFPQAVKRKEGELVVFAWIIFKTKAERNRINKRVGKDPRLADMMDPKALPFDGKRMFWGGFKPIVWE